MMAWLAPVCPRCSHWVSEIDVCDDLEATCLTKEEQTCRIVASAMPCGCSISEDEARSLLEAAKKVPGRMTPGKRLSLEEARG